MPKTIKLVDGEEKLPKTFEEWVAIHGEPEYLHEEHTRRSNKLNIVVKDCTPKEIQCDTTDIIYEDKNGRKSINYPKFLECFRLFNPLVYNNGVFYTPDGAVSKDTIKQDIHYSLITRKWTNRLDSPTNSIFESLKHHTAVESLEVDSNVIPLANGDLHLDKRKWVFKLNEKKHCPYRLSVEYNPYIKPTPLFDKWLHDVFEDDDIISIQEILGYCLVPITSAQEAFILVGDAGVGKSGMGAILKGLLGNAFIGMETQQLVSERFQIATVENKLVAYDDDLGSAALTETGLLKKLITADVPIKAEKKYADPHEFTSYCRIIASANFMLSSLYDDSDGFYRRLHPIHVKPKNPNRKNINRFYETILEEEKEQILLWALEGLKRVINNGWKIHWSERSIKYLAKAKSNAIHYDEFLSECFDFGEGDVSTADIKKTYKTWCRENGITPTSDRRLEKWLLDNAERLGIENSRCVRRGNKQIRGYKNLKLKPQWNSNLISI